MKKELNSNAFSLIELSIVLIIIGLLVVGIMGAANLIKTAKIRGFINEIREYRQAVYTFKAIKDRYPGDIYNTGVIGFRAGYTYQPGAFAAPYDGSKPEYGTPREPTVGPFVELYLEKILGFEPKDTGNTSGHWLSHIALANNGALPRSNHQNETIIYYQYSNYPTQNGIYAQGMVGNLIVFNPEDKYVIDPTIIKNIDQKLDNGIFNSGILRGMCQGPRSYGYNTYDDAINSNKKCAWFFLYLE